MSELLFDAQSPMLMLGVLAATVLILYLAREPAHALILGLCRDARRVLRAVAVAVARAERSITARNRESMRAVAADMQERAIEREFGRVQNTLMRDISGYPQLHRTLTEQIQRIETDYQRTQETPPMPPAWLEAIEAVARVPANNDPAIARILEDMHGTLENSSHQALLEYRNATRRRHRGLRRMQPYWRRLDTTLGRVERTVTGLAERAGAIDRHMERYDRIRSGDESLLRAMTLSSVSQFFMTGFVLSIAILAAVFNFQLLLPGMAGLMGDSGGGLSSAALAASFITLLQIGMGLVILESLRVTRMLPLIGGLDDLARTRLLTAATGVLLALTALEASLAFSTARDLFPAEQLQAAAGNAPQWVGGMMLMLLGTVLPLVLAFVAVPLEGFINSARAAAGLLLALALRMASATLRAAASLVQLAGRIATRLYDLAIFAPLWLESRLRRPRRSPQAMPAAARSLPVEPAVSQPPAAARPRREQRVAEEELAD